MKKHKAFTVIELLIVIVVIGIIASVVLVSYSNISSRANASALQTDLNSAGKQLETFRQTNSSYPTSLISANIKASNGSNLTYYTTTNNTQFCLKGVNGSSTYSISSSNLSPQLGDCLTNGLVAWWKMNGNANDSSGNGNNLSTFGNPSMVNGYNNTPNGAYFFNGTTDYMQANNLSYGVISSSNYNSQWSLSIWAKWSTIYSSEATLIGRIGCNGGITTFNISGTYYYTFMIKGAGCWTGSTTLVSNTVLDTNWHNLIATYDNGFMSFYDNAVLKGTGTLGSMYPSYSTCFGIASPCTANYMFNGTLDDARVYNRSLSQAEVTDLYNLGAQ